MNMPPINHFKRFDVRAMRSRGVEPFPKIHQRVTSLKAGKGWLVIAPLLPSPLIEKRTGAGFASKVEGGNGADWLVCFWRAAWRIGLVGCWI